MSKRIGEEDFADTVPQAGLDEEVVRICGLVNMRPILQSMLYDLNLLPEQTMNSRRWHYTVSAVLHMEALRAELSVPSTGD